MKPKQYNNILERVVERIKQSLDGIEDTGFVTTTWVHKCLCNENHPNHKQMTEVYELAKKGNK